MPALTAPIKQIAENTGFDGSIVAQKVDESSDPNMGFNAMTTQYEDLVKAGVIVPTKAIRPCSIKTSIATTKRRFCPNLIYRKTVKQRARGEQSAFWICLAINTSPITDRHPLIRTEILIK